MSSWFASNPRKPWSLRVAKRKVSNTKRFFNYYLAYHDALVDRKPVDPPPIIELRVAASADPTRYVHDDVSRAYMLN